MGFFQVFCFPRKFHGMDLRWRQNGCDSVSNHQPYDCLLNRLFRCKSKKTSKLRVTGLFYMYVYGDFVGSYFKLFSRYGRTVMTCKYKICIHRERIFSMNFVFEGLFSDILTQMCQMFTWFKIKSIPSWIQFSGDDFQPTQILQQVEFRHAMYSVIFW